TIFPPTDARGQKVVVFGRTGVGKSSLCHNLCYRWGGHGLWPQFDLVICFHLRDLKADVLAAAPSDICLEYLTRMQACIPADVPLSDLHALINGSRTLFILDGYDETSGLDKNDKDAILWAVI